MKKTTLLLLGLATLLPTAQARAQTLEFSCPPANVFNAAPPVAAPNENYFHRDLVNDYFDELYWQRSPDMDAYLATIPGAAPTVLQGNIWLSPGWLGFNNGDPVPANRDALLTALAAYGAGAGGGVGTPVATNGVVLSHPAEGPQLEMYFSCSYEGTGVIAGFNLISKNPTLFGYTHQLSIDGDHFVYGEALASKAPAKSATPTKLTK